MTAAAPPLTADALAMVQEALLPTADRLPIAADSVAAPVHLTAMGLTTLTVRFCHDRTAPPCKTVKSTGFSRSAASPLPTPSMS
jgi:hypothetical protein